MNYLRLDIITKNLIYFLVFVSDVADKNIQIMTGISQAL
ncbi:Similarity (fragment) [Microcystis aeruginosa PCC 9701]|uniref:Similarity n=1 Tax=Microcystis aeruginosa PCC 9701 TaxID=721123 RepID=I4IWV4_MICAE